jgi:zinc transport system permease protein
MNIIELLLEMFSYNFLLRAMIVGALVSLCAALLGLSLVLKRYSMIGDGLSHVGFGALALATAMNAAPLAVSIPVVVLAAFLLLRLSENHKIKGDAAIAMISTGALALGVIVISLTTGLNTDVCNYLFGSILAMSRGDVYLSIGLSLVVLALFAVFYHILFGITFDETFAKTGGVKTGPFNMLIALLTALTIVLGMRMMGAMLISSLIVFPALTSMRVFKTWKSVSISSAVVALVSFFIGLVLSYVYALPTGASVVMVNIAAFIIFWGYAKAKNISHGSSSRSHRAVAGVAVAGIAGVLLLGACTGRASSRSITKAAQEQADLAQQNTDAANAAAAKAASEAIAASGLHDEAASLSRGGSETRPYQGEEGPVIVIREKLFIAQTNEIYLNAPDYLGRRIRLEGLFKTQTNGVPGDPVYNFVLRYGPGCCGYDGTAGFEVAWEGEAPKEDDWVEAEGVLAEYDENGFKYLYLALDTLNVLDTRGAEVVLQ